MWPRTHQQEQWRRSCFGFGPREPPRAPAGSALHGPGDPLVSGQTGGLAGRSLPVDAWDSEILSFCETGSPLLSLSLSLWRKLEGEGPVRGSGQVQGGAHQGKLGKVS